MNPVKIMVVDEFTYFCAWMASIAGFITPLWFASLYLIRLSGDRRDQMPKPAQKVGDRLCGDRGENNHRGEKN